MQAFFKMQRISYLKGNGSDRLVNKIKSAAAEAVASAADLIYVDMFTDAGSISPSRQDIPGAALRQLPYLSLNADLLPLYPGRVA